MTFAYPRRYWALRACAPDAVLVVAAAAALAGARRGPFELFFAVACVTVVFWGVVSIHFPSKVELSEHAVVFHGYGRAHAFAWDRVARVRVRRFLVRDRVLVRISPGGAWRGRYWLTDALDGYEALVRELERRART